MKKTGLNGYVYDFSADYNNNNNNNNNSNIDYSDVIFNGKIWYKIKCLYLLRKYFILGPYFYQV